MTRQLVEAAEELIGALRQSVPGLATDPVGDREDWGLRRSIRGLEHAVMIARGWDMLRPFNEIEAARAALLERIQAVDDFDRTVSSNAVAALQATHHSLGWALGVEDQGPLDYITSAAGAQLVERSKEGA